MANSRFRITVEEYVREWMRQAFGHTFRAAPIQLCDGGMFDCDAVSTAGTVIACICTNAGITISGKKATPKLHKIRSDILPLLRATANRRIIALTNSPMYELCREQARAGRLPREIELVLVPLPVAIHDQLVIDHEEAAAEVMPKRTGT
jgi:hypothetical protein